MRNSIWQRKIPTLLGILFIVVTIGVTTFLANQTTLFRIKAGASTQPKNVQVTNITDSSFTVTYTTDDVFLGSVEYGTGKTLGSSALDERDQSSGGVNPYKAHSITVHGLSPSTKYFFDLVSGKDKYLNNGALYETTTGDKVSDNPTDQNPLSGVVVDDSGAPVVEALAYLTVDGAEKISVLVKSNGTYVLPLNSLRSSDLSSYFSFSSDSVLNLKITDGAIASEALLNIDQTSPVPTITLGRTYDFRSGNEPLGNESTQSAQQSQSFPVVTAEQSQNPSIDSPSNNQTFTDQQPDFTGSAKPNQEVQIEIHSNETITTTVTSGSDGSWSFRPDKPLTPGKHTITISTANDQGLIQKITRTFTVFAAGSQVNESATPSATIAPSPTVAPTLLSSPTPTPTPGIIAGITEEPIASPSPTLPPTGSSDVIIAGIISMALTTLGIFLFLLTRRKASL